MEENPNLLLYPKEHLKCMGRVFKQYRKESGFSIRDVAKTAKISHTIVFDIEQGKVTPNSSTLSELFEVLGIPFYDDPDILWPLRDITIEMFYSFHHKEEEKVEMYYQSLLRGEKILMHSALLPHFLFAKAIYEVEFTDKDATSTLDELEYFSDYFMPIQKQGLIMLKGINEFNNTNLSKAFNLLNKAGKMDVFSDITNLSRYYQAFTADKLFKKELSLYYAFIVSEHYSENNNFKRKIDIDILQAKNMIELGNYQEAKEYLNSIHYAITNFNNMHGDKDWLLNLYAYLLYMQKDYQTALYYADQVENQNNLIKHLVYSILFTRMDKKTKAKRSLDFLMNAKTASTPIYQSIAVILAENAGYEINENTMLKAIDTVLTHPYEIKTTYIHSFTNELIIKYYENKGDLNKALEVAKRMLYFYSVNNIDETKIE